MKVKTEMNLLPKHTSDFSSTEYWNKFFKSRGKEAFEWYGEYPELSGHLHKYIRPKDRVLIVGCGNSKLSQDLYDIGYRSIVNIDISPVVIKQMQEANRTRTEMTWGQMDATAMSYDNESFNVVLDKGTLDAMATDDSDEVRDRCQKYLQESARVLNERGGRFVCITLLQANILKLILEYFPSNNFMLRIARCTEAELKTAETSTSGQAMPVFVVIATKFKALPQKVLEVNFAGDVNQRLPTEDDVRQAVESVQQSAMVRNGLVKNTQAALEKEIQLELHTPGISTPRYTVHILDQKPVRGAGKFACFVVPQGRETDWLFSTAKGRRRLQESSKFNRLVVVSMHRDHQYTSLDEVQRELDGYVTSLAPYGLKDKIPYLSLGSDVGKREIVHKGSSDFSGPYVVEDITYGDTQMIRRLVFLNNQFTVQSEAAIKVTNTKDGVKKVVDKMFLSCQHHLYMTVGVNLSRKDNGRVLVIGLGGGALCTFIQLCSPNQLVTAVEIDPAILDIATNYFGLSVNANLKVELQDGLKYLKERALETKPDEKFDAILFDVDSKDSSVGISCPPKTFLTTDVMDAVKRLLSESGVFILNLVCRDDELRDQIVTDMNRHFTSVCAFKLDEDLNEIIYCRDTPMTESLWQDEFKKAVKHVNTVVKKHKLDQSNLLDIYELIDELKI